MDVDIQYNVQKVVLIDMPSHPCTKELILYLTMTAGSYTKHIKQFSC